MLHDFFSLFVCNIEKLIAWRICTKENYYNPTKNSREFQTSVTETCTCLSKPSGMFRQNPKKHTNADLKISVYFCVHVKTIS